MIPCHIRVNLNQLGQKRSHAQKCRKSAQGPPLRWRKALGMPRRCLRPGYGGFRACGGSVNFGHYRKKHRTREMFWKSSEARLFLGKNQRTGPFVGRNRFPGLNKTISRAFRHTLRRRSMASKTEGRGIWPAFSTRNKV